MAQGRKPDIAPADQESGYVFETEDMNLEKLRFYRDYLANGIADVCGWAINDAENR